jgi:glutamate dehydrogenase (NAD(P)+)
VWNGDGLDIPKLLEHSRATKSVVGFEGAEPISNEALLVADAEVLVPAALGHVLTKSNAREVQAKYVLEAANGPTSMEADEIFNERGILCLPDIFANAGGVTVSYFEWTQNTQNLRWTEDFVNEKLEHHMVEAYRAIRKAMDTHRTSMRTAAFVLAVERVKAATDLRGIG